MAAVRPIVNYSGTLRELQSGDDVAGALPRNAEITTVTANTTLTSSHNGQVIDCNNSGAITLTIADANTAGWNVTIVRRNTGTVAIARQTSGTLNGASTSISISARWKWATVFAYATGAFAVDAG